MKDKLVNVMTNSNSDKEKSKKPLMLLLKVKKPLLVAKLNKSEPKKT